MKKHKNIYLIVNYSKSITKMNAKINTFETKQEVSNKIKTVKNVLDKSKTNPKK